MMSKTLFIVLIGCAVAFASPVKQNLLEEKSVPEEAIQIGSTVKDFIEQLFGVLLGKIGGIVEENLQETFEKLGEYLHSQEYDEAVDELAETLQKISDFEEQIKNDEETKEYLENEVQKVAEAFEKLVYEAAAKIENNEEGTVNAEEFKKAVHEFKEIVDKAL